MARSGRKMSDLRLSPKHNAAIAALIQARSITAASVMAGIPVRTLHRWLNNSEFRAALLAAEDSLIDASTRRLISLADGAIDTLEEVKNDPEASDVVKLRAAQAILDYLLKMRELRNIEARLSELEAAVYGKGREL